MLTYLRNLLLILLISAACALADSSAFDLPGPSVSVRVTRAGKSLPISAVPNLQPGDRIWVHPDLPTSQSVHYLLIGAFLRGATNPPPDNWFTKADTWSKKVREEGIVLTVPEDAEQLLLFLAPETGGDFSSLRSAVRGKPGAFVRAAQDLNQASLDRLRLDAYLDAVRKTSDTAPETLHDRSVLLARSLNIKLDHQCFDKPSEQQAPCLMQNTDQLVLEDGHSQSMVTALTSGASSDLIGQLSTTRVAGGGLYSPYVGVIVDLARMMESFRTAGYQYIPALALPKSDALNLRLNNPPSFRKPMSVMVIGLPAIEKAQKPPLRAVDANEIFCLQKPHLVLPVEGAPLVFSTGFARNVVLRLKNKTGKQIDLPAAANPMRGGFAIDARNLQSAATELSSAGTVDGVLSGEWGFETFEGPGFHLLNAHASKWTVPPGDQTALIVGRDDTLHLQSDASACVDQITMQDAAGKEVEATWKALKEGKLEVQVSLKNEAAGPVTFRVKQYGLNNPDEIPLRSYSEVGHIDNFILNAGDSEAMLEGTRLDEVAGLQVSGIQFAPGELARDGEKDKLRISVPDATVTKKLHEGDKAVVHVALKDGRSLDVPTTILPPRPKVVLLSKSAEPGPSSSSIGIRLGSENELSQDDKLSFFLKSEIPSFFPRNEKIEVAAADESFHVLLGLEDGSLVLQDSQNVLAQLDPMKSFGASAFGSLRFRPVQVGGRNGDWQPLTSLVRVPALNKIRCSGSAADKECTLSGSNLFLLDSIASDEQFKNSVSVPPGFRDSTISIPRPTGDLLYIKLRDDPSVVSAVMVPESSRENNSRAESSNSAR
ncbi:MAG: hypothetical protein M3O09_15640 [Acidobacteriota bacterium]|nr:hypothetical protein [Acidobacteriota bacterium]